MSELELFLLRGVLTPNFNTMDLVKILGKNQKLHIQIIAVTLKVMSCNIQASCWLFELINITSTILTLMTDIQEFSSQRDGGWLLIRHYCAHRAGLTDT
jgi:hypothetical protein